MKLKRYWTSFRLLTIQNGYKRADYLRKRKVFQKIGENVCMQLLKIPLYANKISVGNNVVIGAGVLFCTHDIIGSCFPNEGIKEKVGDIVIGNDVFVGANSIIMYDCKIGNCVIIAAGSVVTKSIPGGEVWGGNPARFICETKEFLKKRRGR